MQNTNNSSILETSEISKAIIKYRFYKAEDSDQLIEVEETTSQRATYRGLMKAGTIYREEFDVKSKNFDEYVILVAEAHPKDGSQRPELCGCICVGMKSMYFNGKLQKSGVLYDLRVRENYQKNGIGNTLCRLSENYVMEKGVTFIYLSVNASNSKATGLYKKIGYETISKRKIMQLPLPEQENRVAPSSKEIEFDGKKMTLYYERLKRKDILKFYNEFYKNQDLGLENWEEMLDAPGYLGTYCVRTEDSQNVAGLTLYTIKKVAFMGVKKLAFNTAIFQQLWSMALILTVFILLLLGPLTWISHLPEYLGIGKFLSCVIGCAIIGVSIWYAIFRFVKGLKRLRAMAGFAQRGRIVGPFFKVKNEDLLPTLLKYLGERVQITASNDDIVLCLYNCDENDYFASRIPNLENFTSTIFMGKYLKGGTSLKEYKPTKYMYFDPRDL